MMMWIAYLFDLASMISSFFFVRNHDNNFSDSGCCSYISYVDAMVVSLQLLYCGIDCGIIIVLLYTQKGLHILY